MQQSNLRFYSTLYSYIIKEKQEYKVIAVFLIYFNKINYQQIQHYTVKSSKKIWCIKASQFFFAISIKSLRKLSINEFNILQLNYHRKKEYKGIAVFY